MSKKIQSILKLPTGKGNATCKTCEMTYNLSVFEDVKLHSKYHEDFINGIGWPEHMNIEPLSRFTIIQKRLIMKNGKMNASCVEEIKHCQIISVDIFNKKQIAKAEQLLQMCNRELNASEDSGQWKHHSFKSAKAFILILEKRAIGICSTDEVKQGNGRWMIDASHQMIPNQINSKVRIGISRIWIAPNWRHYGLGKKLLQVVLNNSIYGVSLNRHEIGFSQPSFSGGKLAASFSGTMHKSGKLLIPIYMEE